MRFQAQEKKNNDDISKNKAHCVTVKVTGSLTPNLEGGKLLEIKLQKSVTNRLSYSGNYYYHSFFNFQLFFC